MINARTVPALRVAAVAGGANNQLERAEDGEALRVRGILFAPDYVMNAGGVTKMCGDYFGWPS
ncbi:MAG: amino acid dehydrogenase, partial [Pseudomonadota bacterium]